MTNVADFESSMSLKFCLLLCCLLWSPGGIVYWVVRRDYYGWIGETVTTFKLPMMIGSKNCFVIVLIFGTLYTYSLWFVKTYSWVFLFA